MECVLQEKALPQSSSVADEKMPTTKVKAKPKEKKSTKRAAEGETMADDGAKKAKGAADSHRLVSSEVCTAESTRQMTLLPNAHPTLHEIHHLGIYSLEVGR